MGMCHHRRAYFYYLHSIRDPTLFPSFACSSVDECNQGVVHPDQPGTFMGEQAAVSLLFFILILTAS
jgi:hypothetical protein